MQKINAMDVRRALGDILARAKLRGEEFIVEKGGKAVAVIMPYRKVELLREKAWNKIMTLFTKISRSGLTDDEVQDLVNEAIHMTRKSSVSFS